MGFGDSIKQAYGAATVTAKAAASALISGAEKVGGAAIAAGNAAVQAGRAAVGIAQEATEAAAEATANAISTGISAAERGIAAAERAVNKAVDATVQTMTAAVRAAYDKVNDAFGPQLVGQPIAECPLEVEAKKKRLKYRSKLLQRAKKKVRALQGADKRNVKAAIDRFELNNTAVERARLAADVYDDVGNPPPGWKRLSDDPEALKKMGLRPEDFHPTNSDFRAALYESEIDGKKTKVLAFKGTTSLEDWGANISQATGSETEYYSNAIRLAQKVQNIDPNVETTGHSLGGGMSSAASLVTGAKGYTFNAAGVHPNTVKNFGPVPAGDQVLPDGKPLIDAFHVEGEALTTVQDKDVQEGILAVATVVSSPPLQVASGALLARSAAGTPLAYSAPGRSHELPWVDSEGYTHLEMPWNFVTKHFMENCINGLEKQKADDLYELQQAVGQR